MSTVNYNAIQPERVRKVRVLVIGDSGAGKTSLVNLLVNEEPCRSAKRTVGVNVAVKLVEYPKQDASGAAAPGESFFVELWDVGTHSQYAAQRSVFYSEINGVILVHDLTSRRSAQKLYKWADEVGLKGTFSAPSYDDMWSQMHPAAVPEGLHAPGAAGLGLPVPCLILGNKLDIADLPRPSGASPLLPGQEGGWVGRLARMVGLKGGGRAGRTGDPFDCLPPAHQYQGGVDPSGKGLQTSAAKGVLDLRKVESFFLHLIQRRYFSGSSGGPDPAPPSHYPAQWGYLPSAAPGGPLPPPADMYANPFGTAGSHPAYAAADQAGSGALQVGSPEGSPGQERYRRLEDELGSMGQPSANDESSSSQPPGTSQFNHHPNSHGFNSDNSYSNIPEAAGWRMSGADNSTYAGAWGDALTSMGNTPVKRAGSATLRDDRDLC